MSSRICSSLIYQTVLLSLVYSNAMADDILILPRTNQTIDSLATHSSLTSTQAKEAPAVDTLPQFPSTIVVQSDNGVKSLPVIGSDGDHAVATAQPVGTGPADLATTQAPPASSAPTPLVAAPASTAAVLLEAPKAPDSTSKQVTSASTSEHIGSTDSTSAQTPTPATPALAISKPVEEKAPAASNTALPTTITAEMMASALKGEIEARFGTKPIEDKKLSAEERKTHASIMAYYVAHSFQPMWVDGNGLTQRGKEAADRLARAQEDGLNAADYPAPTMSGTTSAESLAKAELQLTESALKYARQAQAGRFDPIRLSDLVTAKPTIPDPDAVLKTLAASTNVSESLEAFNPPHEGFKRLKSKLAEILKGAPLVPQARVPEGPTIRPGEKDTRVALLRNRLGVNGSTTVNDANVYDDGLVDAVKSFQKKNGLKPSGLISAQTIDLVNEAAPGADTRAADIIANMERWRWLPRDLGELHVMVNIPDFALTVVRDGVVTHRAKAIVGRVANPTPVFSNTMTHIIVNPYWNVPYSIVKKEYLGKAQETKGEALTRGNFEVQVGNKTVDPSAVDWSTVNASEVHLRQRPGEGNALGNIKFMFPNEHSVYIHDTSSRGLFVQSYRSLSHGCVRVQDPFSFADALLAAEPTQLTGAKLKAMIGGDEKYLWLKKTIPVHIAYFTDFVDDAGVLQTRPDLYGHNAKTKQLLGL